MRPFLTLALAGAAFVALSGRSFAQSTEGMSESASQKGFRAEFLAQLGVTEKKLVDLAEAMPDAKYSWRPEKGVRSVSEVYAHVAGSNYFFLSFIGVKPPADLPKDMEKTVTTKAAAVKALKESFTWVRDAVLKLTDADLDKPATMFGKETTERDVLFNMALHMHEHLGQSIAYARMNGVVPPWTAAQMKKSKGQKGG